MVYFVGYLSVRNMNERNRHLSEQSDIQKRETWARTLQELSHRLLLALLSIAQAGPHWWVSASTPLTDCLLCL